ncbi:hypothetical protein P886_1323 [Alteromonadaceae bacterium 2753L.S.0a.02]|nr:hypothetical protein P886_1323 [Alteromonadaceae bacterium 2753L.S.0a.02]
MFVCVCRTRFDLRLHLRRSAFITRMSFGRSYNTPKTKFMRHNISSDVAAIVKTANPEKTAPLGIHSGFTKVLRLREKFTDATETISGDHTNDAEVEGS